jgi:hypothetical protein
MILENSSDYRDFNNDNLSITNTKDFVKSNCRRTSIYLKCQLTSKRYKNGPSTITESSAGIFKILSRNLILLLGKHNSRGEELQSEVINLPEKTEDMHLLLLTYREQLISAKLASEHHEEKRRQVRVAMG